MKSPQYVEDNKEVLKFREKQLKKHQDRCKDNQFIINFQYSESNKTPKS